MWAMLFKKRERVAAVAVPLLSPHEAMYNPYFRKKRQSGEGAAVVAFPLPVRTRYHVAHIFQKGGGRVAVAAVLLLVHVK